MTFVEAKARVLRMATELRLRAAEGARVSVRPGADEAHADNRQWTTSVDVEKDAEALELLARFVP